MKRLKNVTEIYTDLNGNDMKRVYNLNERCEVVSVITESVTENIVCNETVYKYNMYGDIIESLIYNYSDKYLTSYRSVNTEYIYSNDNRVISSKVKSNCNSNLDGTRIISSKEVYNFFIYHNDKSVEVITYEDGSNDYIKKVYDNHGNLTKLYSNDNIVVNEYTYDDSGYLIEKVSKPFNIKYINDNKGNCIQKQSSGFAGYVYDCEYKYDTDGDIVYEKDSFGHEWYFRYAINNKFELNKTCSPRNSNDIYSLSRKYKQLFC